MARLLRYPARSAIRLFISAWPVGLENSIEWELADLLVAVDDE